MKERKKVYNVILELDIFFFVRVRLDLPRWNPKGSQSSRLAFTPGLLFRPTFNISEKWQRYVFVCLLNHEWFETEAGSWLQDEKGAGVSEGFQTSLQPFLNWSGGLWEPAPVLTGPTNGNTLSCFVLTTANVLLSCRVGVITYVWFST